MTAESETLSDAALDRPAVAAPPVSGTQPFYWSVRRELWENRSIYLAPLVVAGVVLFGFLVSALRLGAMHTAFTVSDGGRTVVGVDPGGSAVAMAIPYLFAAAAIAITGLIVAVFYCLAALHGERRDRSILFWKSLPVSDLITVISKAVVPLVILPALVFVIILATQALMLLIGAVGALSHGAPVTPPWTHLPFFRVEGLLLYALPALTLWYAPIYAWLLLVSGWARRAPFLWAVLPPLGVCLLEKIALNTNYLWVQLSHRLTGGAEEAFAQSPQTGSQMDQLPRIDLAGYLSSPGLWTGLVVAAAFLAAAVWLRRNREPI